MKAQLELDTRKLSSSVKALSAKLGEVSGEAIARVGISAARESAILTRPPGKGALKELRKSTDRGVNRATLRIAKKGDWSRIQKGPTPRIRDAGGRWFDVHPGQFTDDVARIDSHVEGARGAGGDVKDLAPTTKLVVPRAAANKVKANRRNLAGAAKGGWVAAGNALAAKVPGVSGISAGKVNRFLLRHRALGRASVKRHQGRIVSVKLTNRAHYLRGVWSKALGEEALRRAWKMTEKWYKRTWKASQK